MTKTLDIDDRIAKCRKILDEDPNSQIFAALAEAHRKKGELDKAFRICKRGLKIHPESGSAHLVMAKINLDRGLYDWAEIEVNKAAASDGRNRAVELLTAEIHIYKGEFNKAIHLLKKLAELNPGDTQVHKLLEIAQKLPEEQTVMMKSDPSPKEPDSAAVVSVAADAGREQPPALLSPEELVEQAITMPGIDGALFVNNEGLVAESKWTLKLDETTVGAVMAETAHAVAQELMQNEFGKVRSILIEAENIMFYQMNVAGGFYLFASGSSSNLGTIRMKLESLLSGKAK